MPRVVDRLREAMPSGLALLGIGSCVACCALPLLLAAGILSGGVVTALTRWLPGLAAALVAAAPLAWWWNSRRTPCASCGTGSQRGAGCSCG